MPTPAKVELSSNVFDSSKGDVPNPDNKVYVSPNHQITALRGTSVRGGSDRLQYTIVVDPKTKTQTMYQTDYNAFGQKQKLDPTKVIAVKQDNGKFVPVDETNATIPPKILNKINNSESTQETLNNTADYTVKSSLKVENGKAPTPTEVAEVTDGKIEPEDETAVPDSDGSQSGLTITTSNQDKVSNFAAGKEDLAYPIGAKGGESDYIKFTAMKYLPSNPSTGSGSFGTAYQKGDASGIGQSVQLPIQGGIQDSNAVGWNEDTLSVMQAAGAEIAKSGIEKGGTDAVNTLLNQAKTLKDQAGPVKQAIADSIAGQAVGSNIMARTSRSILNPNTELLFQGPQLRAFSFNFKMTPRSEDEAQVVKSIIKFFKFHMAPKVSDANLFLKAPNIFKLEYFQKGQQHSGINLIKDCALQACTVDYTPDGTYMAYNDGSMFSYDLQLQFMELIPIYAKDYNEGDAANHPIGY